MLSKNRRDAGESDKDIVISDVNLYIDVTADLRTALKKLTIKEIQLLVGALRDAWNTKSHTSGSMRNLKTIEDMEADAKEQADGSSNKRIRDSWLEVQLVTGSAEADGGFVYKWGKNYLNRTAAIALLKTVQ